MIIYENQIYASHSNYYKDFYIEISINYIKSKTLPKKKNPKKIHKIKNQSIGCKSIKALRIIKSTQLNEKET